MPGETLLEDMTPTRAMLERLSDEGEPVLFRGCDFEELDLGGLEMIEWRFDTCNLARAWLTGARLEEVTFDHCRAPGARFVAATLSDVVVDGGDFGNTNFLDATLSSVAFRRCKMTGTDMTGVSAINVTDRKSVV